jgi:hypothetical protein
MTLHSIHFQKKIPYFLQCSERFSKLCYTMSIFTKAIFWPRFYVLYSTLLRLLSLRFHCVGGC